MKYTITITETIAFDVNVEANNIEDAEEFAEESLLYEIKTGKGTTINHDIGSRDIEQKGA